jgi:hypothetical protein
MADLSYTYYVDGDSITAASLNTAFTGVQTGINDLMGYALKPGALRSEHFSGQVMLYSGWTTAAGVSGHTVGGTGTHQYGGSGDPLGSGAFDYTAYGGDPRPDATDRCLVGVAPVTGTYSASNRLQLEHAGLKLGMDQSDNVAGILCMYNVEFLLATSITGSALNRVHAITSLEFKVGTSWYVLPRSTRMCGELNDPTGMTGDTYTNHDMATVVLLRQSDLTDAGLAANSQVKGIRVMVSVDQTDADDIVVLNSSRLTILPLHADLT